MCYVYNITYIWEVVFYSQLFNYTTHTPSISASTKPIKWSTINCQPCPLMVWSLLLLLLQQWMLLNLELIILEVIQMASHLNYYVYSSKEVNLLESKCISNARLLFPCLASIQLTPGRNKSYFRNNWLY